MSNYKGHLAGGVATFVLIVAVTNAQTSSLIQLGEWLVFTLGGALFPDVDIKSKGQKIFYQLLLVTLLYFIIQQKVMPVMFLGVAGALPMVVRHRGIFHHPWFIIVLSAVPVALAYVYRPGYLNLIWWDALFFCAGAFSHLVLDRGIVKVFKQLMVID